MPSSFLDPVIVTWCPSCPLIESTLAIGVTDLSASFTNTAALSRPMHRCAHFSLVAFAVVAQFLSVTMPVQLSAATDNADKQRTIAMTMTICFFISLSPYGFNAPTTKGTVERAFNVLSGRKHHLSCQ